jgi:hypothetical protein
LHLYESQNKKFDLGTYEHLDFTRSVDFFQGGSHIKNMEEKNIFCENPVEVRSFDGSNYINCSWTTIT